MQRNGDESCCTVPQRETTNVLMHLGWPLNTDSSVSFTHRHARTLKCMCDLRMRAKHTHTFQKYQDNHSTSPSHRQPLSQASFTHHYYPLPSHLLLSSPLVSFLSLEAFVARTWQRKWHHCVCPSPGSWRGGRPRSLHTEWCEPEKKRGRFQVNRETKETWSVVWSNALVNEVPQDIFLFHLEILIYWYWH